MINEEEEEEKKNQTPFELPPNEDLCLLLLAEINASFFN